jgi:hypothetical protein
MKKTTLILNIIAVGIILIGIGYIVFDSLTNPGTEKIQECVSFESLINIKYESCYDINSQNIILRLDRYEDDYLPQEIKVNYDQNSETKEFSSVKLPENNDVEAYKIPSIINPEEIEVFIQLKDLGNFINVCEQPKKIETIACDESQLAGVYAEIILGDDTIEIQKSENQNLQQSDIISSDLIDEEAILELGCGSNWICEGWEICEDGIQKRECRDTNKCFIPTSIPDFTKSCGNTCEENWECSWSSCLNGITNPTCNDENSCGTIFSKPQSLDCSSSASSSCIPEISCSEWSDCNVDYNFEDLITGIDEISGVRKRLCTDQKSCVPNTQEIKSCSVRIDVITEWDTSTGNGLLRIYNKATGQLIARVSGSSEGEQPSLNIDLVD